MPKGDNLDGGLQRENQHWNHAWVNNTGGVYETDHAKSVDLESPEDKEAQRIRREKANGYYFESEKPFCAQTQADLDKYCIGISKPCPEVQAISAQTNFISLTQKRAAAAIEAPSQVGRKVTVTPIHPAEVIEATAELAESPIEVPAPTEEQIEEALDTVVNTKPTTPREAQKVINSLQVLTSHIDRLYAQYEAELSKGDAADMDKLSELAMRMFTIWDRMSARHDEDLSLEMTHQLHGYVQKVKDTYNHIGSLIFTIASSILSVLGGLGQMVGGGVQMAGGTRLITLEKAKSIVKLGGAGTAIGSGVGMPAKLFDESAAGDRTKKQHQQTEHQRRRDEKTQKANQNDARSRETLRSLENQQQIAARKKTAMLSGSATE